MKLLNIATLPLWYSLFTAYSGHCMDYVKGYSNSNGTYTQSYSRSSLDSYRNNNLNYSSQGSLHTNGYGRNSQAVRNSMDSDITNDNEK